MTDTSRWKSTIYIGGLPPQVTTQILSEAFLPFGEIVEISLPKNDGRNNRQNQNQNQNDSSHPDSAVVDSQHRGYAYVEFEDPEDAKEAIDNMDQSELFGRVIKVSAAKIPKSATANQGLGSKTAVWEQEGWLAENAVSEEDRLVSEQALNNAVLDPMQGLEGLDVAGPKPEL
ncbi:putative cyclophilin [Cladorrhinum sp. PSN259]|nr:putative cyclophilin [Cladorrhinum sp. PSN259]